jgi:hypothetical protein
MISDSITFHFPDGTSYGENRMLPPYSTVNSIYTTNKIWQLAFESWSQHEFEMYPFTEVNSSNLPVRGFETGWYLIPNGQNTEVIYNCH